MHDKETVIRDIFNVAIDMVDDSIAQWAATGPIMKDELGRLARVRLDLIECLKSLDHRPPAPFKPQD